MRASTSSMPEAASRQLGTIRLERVEHLGGVATGIVRVETQVSNTACGRNTGGRTSTHPDAASIRPTARRPRCCGVRPRPAGACGSTDGICSRPSRRSTSSTRSVAGCVSVRAPRRRRHDELTVPGLAHADLDGAADLCQTARGRTVRVGHTGHPSGRSMSMRICPAGVTPPMSVRTGSTVPPAISTSSAAARSSAGSATSGRRRARSACWPR